VAGKLRNLPTYEDKPDRAVAIIKASPAMLDWLCESLNQDDQVTKELHRLRARAKDVLWEDHAA